MRKPKASRWERADVGRGSLVGRALGGGGTSTSKGDDLPPAAVTQDCPFCDYQGPSPILWEDDLIYAVKPNRAAVPGHVLVIPKRHIRDAYEHPEIFGQVMARASRYSRWMGAPDANIIASIGPAATQTVWHLHVHVLPRGDKDGMPSGWPWRDWYDRNVGPTTKPRPPHQPL